MQEIDGPSLGRSARRCFLEPALRPYREVKRRGCGGGAHRRKLKEAIPGAVNGYVKRELIAFAATGGRRQGLLKHPPADCGILARIDGDIHWLSCSLVAWIEPAWNAKELTESSGVKDPVIHLPTLVIWGLKDNALLTGNLSGLDKWVTDLSVKLYPDDDHWVMIEKYKELAQDMRQFIEGKLPKDSVYRAPRK